MLVLATLLSLSSTAIAEENCAPSRRHDEPARYEDFYSIRRRAEARDEAREAASHEVHDRNRAHRQKIEEAREEYVHNRRPKPDKDGAEERWLAERKARQAKIEDARECFVTERDHLEHQTKRGRVIPGDVEFGLNE